MKHSTLKRKALKRADVSAAYGALEPEFELLRQMLRARARAGLSQADVAELMGTHAPAVTRLESALGTGKHSPSVDTLKRYAAAVNCALKIELISRSRRKGKVAA